MDVIEEEVVKATQAVMRAYREMLALLGEVADSIVTEDDDGGAIVHLAAPVKRQIRRMVGK